MRWSWKVHPFADADGGSVDVAERPSSDWEAAPAVTRSSPSPSFGPATHSITLTHVSCNFAMRIPDISSDVLLEILKKLCASDVLTVRLVMSSLFQSTHCAVSNNVVDVQIHGDVDTYQRPLA